MSKPAKSPSRPRTARRQPVLHPEQSVQEAGDKMRDLHADTLPVSDGCHLVGIVDQAQPDLAAAGFGHDPKTTTVGDIMNSSVAYCFEHDTCGEALQKMNERNLDRLPVVDREMRIVGVVTRSDLAKCAPTAEVSH